MSPPLPIGESRPKSSSSFAELGRDPGPPAQLAELDQVDPLPQADRLAALALGRRGIGQLVADHAQRQELVALQAQDRHEPLDIMLGE